MKVSDLIKTISLVVVALNLGTFYKDVSSVNNAKKELYDCSLKVDEKFQNKEEIFEVIPSGIFFESTVKNETIYYTLKKHIKLCFNKDKIIELERTYFRSSF